MFKNEQLEKICENCYSPENDGIADFCFCCDKNLWHFFYILYENHIEHDCHHPDQNKKIGYSTSPDLINWQLQEPAIQARPGKWDCGHVWAPAVIKKDNKWYMFYTGTNDGLFQKIGIVTSKDLKSWEYPEENVVIDASKFIWSQPGGVHADAHVKEYFNCRDPYLIEHDGKWLCYYTARAKNEGKNEAVLALSISSDLINWSDEGYVLSQPIFGCDGQGTYMTESPCVFKNKDTFYAIYNQGLGMKYVSSKDPYNFHDCPPKRLKDQIFNFELIDLRSGLFAYSIHGKWMKLYFGKLEIFKNGELKII